MKPRRYSAPDARRVALVSDSHGVVADSVLHDIVGADLVVHAGDVGGKDVLRSLRRIAPLRLVRGNNDTPEQWPPGEGAALARLPDVVEIALQGGLLVVVHGHQWPTVATRHDKLRTAFPQARCVVYGHSHRRVLECAALPWVVNPGACGRIRTYGGASWLGLTIGRDQWRINVSAFA